MATGQAQAEMDPGITRLQAFFTAIGPWFDVMDLIEMRTFLGHGRISLGAPAILP